MKKGKKVIKRKRGSNLYAGGGELTTEGAIKEAEAMGVDFDKDFQMQNHGLDQLKNKLSELAKKYGYVKSKNSILSTEKSFFEFLRKIRLSIIRSGGQYAGGGRTTQSKDEYSVIGDDVEEHFDDYDSALNFITELPKDEQLSVQFFRKRWDKIDGEWIEADVHIWKKKGEDIDVIGTYAKGGEVGDWLFIGTYPNALIYADKRKESHGDYHEIGRIIFSPFSMKISDKSDKYSEAHKIMEDEYEKLKNDKIVQISSTGQIAEIKYAGGGGVRQAKLGATGLTVSLPINVNELSKEEIKTIYLDYVNNFLTTSAFADHYELSDEDAKLIISKGERFKRADGHYAGGGTAKGKKIKRGNTSIRYKGFKIVKLADHYEISNHQAIASRLVYHPVYTTNLDDVKKIIDLANDKTKEDLVKEEFPKDYYDINKRVIYFTNNLAKFAGGGSMYAAGGKAKGTISEYEEYLNEIGTPDADLESNGGRIPDSMPYGTWMRRNDKIAFNVGFQDWSRDNMAGGGKIKSIEEETELLPEVVAQLVSESTLFELGKVTGEAELQARWATLSDEKKAEINKKYKESLNELESHLAEKAEVLFKNNADFRKKVKASGNKGRDYLYMFMHHWADAWVKEKYGQSVYAKYSSISKFENGGIVSEAKAKWDSWDYNQRKHFLLDHDKSVDLIEEGLNQNERDAIINSSWDQLRNDIRNEVIIHLKMGVYKQGGEMTTTDAKEKWNAMNLEQRGTFIYVFNRDIDPETYFKLRNGSFEELPEKMQEKLKTHLTHKYKGGGRMIPKKKRGSTPIYDEVDYEDARSNIEGEFENSKLESAFTKEDVENLANIVHKLRSEGINGVDLWESNKVQDYLVNLVSSYEIKEGKHKQGGEVKNVSSIVNHIEKREPFLTYNKENIMGKVVNDTYVVYYHGYYPLFVYKNEKWYINKDRFSQATEHNKQIYAPQGVDFIHTSREGLENLIGKKLQTYAKGGRITASGYGDKFIPVNDEGEEYFIRDFADVDVDGNDIDLVLVAHISDVREYDVESGGDKPFELTLDVVPTSKYIDKAHIHHALSNVALGIEIADESTILLEVINHIGGIPVIDKNIEHRFATKESAITYLHSEGLSKRIDEIGAVFASYLDQAINGRDKKKWDFLSHIMDASKGI